MKVSQLGLIEIASHEGIVNAPYKDTKGIWTVGIGHTAIAGEPNPATKRGEYSIPEIFEIFARDIKKFEDRVNDAVKVPLKQYEFDALVSFDFNTGGIYKAKLTQSLNAGNRIAAANGFMGWTKPAEIIGRRKKEQALFANGTYSANGKANLYPADSNGKVLWNRGKVVDVGAMLKAHETPVQPPVAQPEPIPTPSTELELVLRKGELNKITLEDFYLALKSLYEGTK